jgi:hypothetical protein
MKTGIAQMDYKQKLMEDAYYGYPMHYIAVIDEV